MTWRIEIGTGTNRVLLGEILTAQSAWGRLTKVQQAAVKDAYPDGFLICRAVTERALAAHGFAAEDNCGCYSLTEAGKAVAKWCVKP